MTIREHPNPGCGCGDPRCLMHLNVPDGWDRCAESCWEQARLRHVGRARYLIRRAA